MDQDARFWMMIDDARAAGQAFAKSRGDRDPKRARHAMAAALKSALKALPALEIIAFTMWLRAQLDRAYRADLWDAAHLLCDGCSDDGFEYFRAWLVSQGRKAFERALQDPESLADLPLLGDPSVECTFEALEYLPAEAYAEAGHGNLLDETPGRDKPVELVGERGREEDIAGKFPRLAARWGTA